MGTDGMGRAQAHAIAAACVSTAVFCLVIFSTNEPETMLLRENSASVSDAPEQAKLDVESELARRIQKEERHMADLKKKAALFNKEDDSVDTPIDFEQAMTVAQKAKALAGFHKDTLKHKVQMPLQSVETKTSTFEDPLAQLKKAADTTSKVVNHEKAVQQLKVARQAEKKVDVIDDHIKNLVDRTDGPQPYQQGRKRIEAEDARLEKLIDAGSKKIEKLSLANIHEMD